MFAQMSSTLLRGARTVHTDVTHGDTSDQTVDVRIVDGLIAEVGSLGANDGETVIDLADHVLLPAAVEPHAHLDKAFLAERVHNPTGDLHGAIDAMMAARDTISVADTVERAERAARLMMRNGYTAIRTHADVMLSNGTRSVEALVEVRHRLAGLVDIEIVALVDWPITGPQGSSQRALLRDAVAAGADLVGGCPHLDAAGTRASTEVLLGLADDLCIGVDLHTDETLDPEVDGLTDLCDLVDSGFAYPVTASHCVSLGQRNEHDQRAIAEAVAAAGINVIALPHTNLFLQGRGRTPMPRALTAVAALLHAGANLAAGADNLQDPFNPVGRACPFETAGLMIMAAHLLPDQAWTSVSHAGRRALGLAEVEVEAGRQADLLAVRVDGLREAIAFGPAGRMVWHRGVRVDETES
jgi:cytosine deaminase